MSPLAQSIRFWLMRRPRPVKLRLHVGKEVSEIECGAPVSWARVAETIDSMEAQKLEALSETGSLIRACKPDELAEQDEDEDDNKAAPAPVVVPFDAETARMKVFADHLAEAYRFSNEQAFGTLAGIVDRLTRRSESTERSLDHMRQILLREAEQRFEAGQEPEGNALVQMASAFLGGIAQSGGVVAPKPTAAPNGAPTTNGKGH